MTDIQIRTCETFITLARGSIKTIMNTRSLSEEEKQMKIAEEEEKIRFNTSRLQELKGMNK